MLPAKADVTVGKIILLKMTAFRFPVSSLYITIPVYICGKNSNTVSYV